MKAHVGVDSKTKLIHSVVATSILSLYSVIKKYHSKLMVSPPLVRRCHDVNAANIRNNCSLEPIITE
jgi:hypothetical protein